MKKSTMLDLLVLVIRRDLVLAMRRRADVLTTLVFFVMVVSLFPLGVGPELAMLRKMAPGVLWVAALLASMLSLGRLFSADYLDGTLEQMMLAPQSLSVLVLGKMAAHWMVSGLPLVLMAPVLGLQFDMSGQALGVLIMGLLLGTPILSMIGAIGAALTLGLRGGGVLLSLLVLLWTIVISPYTSYGDNWAVYPVIVVAFIILIWHIFLVVVPKEISKPKLILYGVIHLALFTYILILSLMLITKDSL